MFDRLAGALLLLLLLLLLLIPFVLNKSYSFMYNKLKILKASSDLVFLFSKFKFSAALKNLNFASILNS